MTRRKKLLNLNQVSINATQLTNNLMSSYENDLVLDYAHITISYEQKVVDEKWFGDRETKKVTITSDVKMLKPSNYEKRLLDRIKENKLEIEQQEDLINFYEHAFDSIGISIPYQDDRA